MRTLLTSIFVLAGSFTAIAAEHPNPQTAPSETAYAQRVLLIYPTKAFTPSVWQALRDFTTAEGKKTLDANSVPLKLSWRPQSPLSGDWAACISLELPPGAPKQAGELMDKVVKELERLLQAQYQQSVSDRDALEQQRLQLERLIADLAESQQQVADKIANVTHQIDASIESVHAAMSKLTQEQQALAIELVGMEARKEALQKTIADQSNRMEARVKADPVCKELQKVVDARTEHLERVKKMVETGQAPISEISTATASLAEVRARLLEREELVASRAGGELLAAWNRELLNLSIDRAEKSAKATFIEDKLDPYRFAAELFRQKSKINDAKNTKQTELTRVLSRLEKYQADIPLEKPSLVITESHDLPAKPPQTPPGDDRPPVAQ